MQLTLIIMAGHGGSLVKADSTASDNVVMDGFSIEDEKAVEANRETFTFQAEVNRLMDIIINSLCK